MCGELNAVFLLYILLHNTSYVCTDEEFKQLKNGNTHQTQDFVAPNIRSKSSRVIANHSSVQKQKYSIKHKNDRFRTLIKQVQCASQNVDDHRNLKKSKQEQFFRSGVTTTSKPKHYHKMKVKPANDGGRMQDLPQTKKIFSTKLFDIE